jgi:hypothetical protein
MTLYETCRSGARIAGYLISRTILLVGLTAPLVYFLEPNSSGISTIICLASLPSLVTLCSLIASLSRRDRRYAEAVKGDLDYVFVLFVIIGVLGAFISAAKQINGLDDTLTVLSAFLASATFATGFALQRRKTQHRAIVLMAIVVGIPSMVAFGGRGGVVAIASLAGGYLGNYTSGLVRPWFRTLKTVWKSLIKMGPPLGGFILGYGAIVLIFASMYGAVWRLDSSSFTFAPNIHQPGLVEFLYFSLVTVATVGYGDITPASRLARALVGTEILLGVGWITVVFATVMASFNSAPSVEDVNRTSVATSRVQPDDGAGTPNPPTKY